MKLSTLLNKELILLDLQAGSKQAAIDELLNLICKQHPELDKAVVRKAVLDRESQQSTYLGNSLALPHARIDKLNDFIIACGRSVNGLRFAETNEAVKFIFLILSCKTKINTLLQTMGALATFFTNAKLVDALTQAKTIDDFISVINKSDISIKQTLVAKDIMRRNPIVLSMQHTLKEVIDLFFTENISGAPVLHDDGRVAGVVTEKELIKIGLPEYMSMMDNISFLSEFEPFEEIFKKEDQILVKDIYSPEYIFVHENVAVIQLAFYFVNKSCRRILVTDDNKKLRGLIMRKDLIRKVIHA